MIQLPPGFDLAGFVSDLLQIGTVPCMIAGILSAVYVLKKTGKIL